MCHQSVGLIARHLEAAGFPTVGLTSARSITERVRQPRAVFFDAPLGHTSGPPDSPDVQRSIVRSALERGVAMTEPGTIADLEQRWHHDRWKADPLGWSRRREDGEAATERSGERSGDSRTPRRPDPQYQTEADREAADAVPWDDQCKVCVGLSR